ncbi:methyltransferase-like protein 17, mitochondrial isoform X2 [Ostrea edulis]|uniref:methyltransferase-like protein 17, mitochondrial isoform X2 n=1 Tax=Ostrea edulis TaxID=37623 RepID=UPI00209473A0|nr:methyltransferase-like protein 17, mitochondrial isoform X2 [Ostrea edulis]
MAAPFSQIMSARICRVCSRFQQTKGQLQIRRSEHKTVDDIQNDYIVSKEETFEEDPFSELSRHFLEVRDDNTKPDNSIILGSPQPFPYQARADPAAMQRIPVTERGFKFKKHPGVMRPKNVIEIPKMMEKALDIIYRDSAYTTLGEDGMKLYKQLMSRRLPETVTALTTKAKQLEPKVIQKLSVKQRTKLEALVAKDSLTEEDEQELRQIRLNILDNIKRELRRTTHHNKPITYDWEFALKYTYARMIPNYSILNQCLTEIKKRDPNFVPETVLNMGSGIGSAVWATNSIWPQSVKQFYCVDNSMEMNKMAARILKEGDENRQSMVIPNVYFRDKLPTLQSGRFSLVICAFTLMDFPMKMNRLQLAKELWERTEGYFVLVDVGTYAGFLAIQEVRRRLLRRDKGVDVDEMDVNIFAPCPHNRHCPKFKVQPESLPCNFEVHHQLREGESQLSTFATERYCYVTFKRGDLAQDITNCWPRIVFQDVKRKGKKGIAHCVMCNPDGSLQNRIISRKRHGKELYRIACESRGGDLLPVQVENDERNITDVKKVSHNTRNGHAEGE